MRKLSPYSIGAPPTFDPCEKCIVKVCCSEACDEKIRYLMSQMIVNPPARKLRLAKKRRKKK
jgi:hypothetical protein